MARLFSEFVDECRSNLMLVETTIVRVYTELLASNKSFVAVDGGAHHAYHTRKMAQLGGCRQVLAVEADPWTLRALYRAIDEVPESARVKIKVIESALQQDPSIKQVSWMSSISHPGRSGVSSIWQNDESVEFRDHMFVDATTIDTLCRNAIAPVGLIKLDLEGGDFMALRGGSETLLRDRPIVVFENSRKAPGIYGFSTIDVAQFFESVDYVPMAFSGEIPNQSDWFSFWEMWAAPKEQANALRHAIKSAIS